MFLIINPEGSRHVVLDSFQEIAKLKMSKIESGTVFSVPIINTNDSGKYDLVLTYIRESVSGNEYFKGFIIFNPKNESYVDIPSRSPSSLFNIPTYKPKYKGVRFDITTLFPAAMLVNGYIPIKQAASVHTALDNWDELMPLLKEAFADKPSQVPMSE